MKIPAFIKSLIKFCDADASRFAIGGVKCESQQGLSKLTATDGRVLASVSYPDDDRAGVDLIVCGKSLSAALTGAILKDGDLSLTSDGRLTSKRAGVAVETVEGRFPRYEDVFSIHEHPSDYAAVKLDPALLRRLCDLHAAAQSPTARGLVLWVKDAQSPVFTCGQHLGDDGLEYTVRGVLMPLAADDPKNGHSYPARPGSEATPSERDDDSPPPAEPEAAEPAPAPEVLDDDAIAATFSDEPEPITSGSMAFAVPDIE